MIYNTFERQAVMLAFIDNFKMLGVVFFAVIPILALMRKPRVPAGGAPVTEEKVSAHKGCARILIRMGGLRWQRKRQWEYN